MATIYPASTPPQSPASERKVRTALAEVDEVTALHSVAWQARRGGRQGDGEADFVLVSPRHGLLVLEVKGGSIQIERGEWYSTDRNGVRHRIKNPFDQARDSKYALLAFLRATEPDLARIPVTHAVVFPDVSVDAVLGAGAAPEIIIDRQGLSLLTQSIQRVFDHWEAHYAIQESQVERLVQLLAPTVSVRRLLKDHVAEAEAALFDLTNEQMEVLHSLRLNRKAVVLGSAGTGKTLLAVEKARQLAEAGSKPLIICFNATLREHLKACLADTAVDVESYHSLSYRVAEVLGVRIDPGKADEWFATGAPSVVNRAREAGVTYDAILVDEAQDFSANWLASLASLTSDDDALTYFFADSHQDLYCRDWSLPAQYARFELSRNCRNTTPIATRVAAVFGDTLSCAQTPGPPPRFIDVERESQIIPYVIRLVDDLVLSEGIEPRQVAVLTDARSLVDGLRETGAAGLLFTTLEGHGIPVETVHRFKGLEREVVVLALQGGQPGVDPKAVAYVGLSRARSALYVVASHTVRACMNWDTSV